MADFGLFKYINLASNGVPTIKNTDLISPIAIESAITSEVAPMAVPVIGPTI
ncbi:hypothetical protein D3C71_2239230 [compost metagenome]